MGLDMYLSKKTTVKNWDFQKNEVYSITSKLNGKIIPHIKKGRVSEITEDVGYWRKDNHIHQWFVKNCQGGVDDCGLYEVE